MDHPLLSSYGYTMTTRNISVMAILAASFVILFSSALVLSYGQELKCTESNSAYPIDGINCLDVKVTEEALAARAAQTEAAVPRPTITAVTAEQIARSTVFVPGVPIEISTPEALAPQDFADGPAYLRGSNSIWRIGGIMGSDPYSHITIYALARTGVDGQGASITLAPYSSSLTTQEAAKYTRSYSFDSTTTAVTIVGFENLQVNPDAITGMLLFQTVAGNLGSLDLSSGSITVTTP